MNDQNVKISYGKVTLNLLMIGLLFVVAVIFLYIILGYGLTALYNVLFPFINFETESFLVMLQYLSFLLILYFSMGILSAKINPMFIKNHPSPWAIGTFTGLAISFVMFISLCVIFILSVRFDYDYLDSFGILFLFLALSFLSIPLVSLGSFSYIRSKNKADKQYKVKKIPWHIIGPVAAAALILLLSVVWIYFSYSSGAIANYNIYYQYSNNIYFDASRANDNSISITFNGLVPESRPDNVLKRSFSPYYFWLRDPGIRLDANMPFIIMVNENISAVPDAHGIFIIGPAPVTGSLACMKGSSVTITGNNARQMNDSGTHLVIAGHTRDNTTALLYDQWIK